MITSPDVIHSFYVPKFLIKRDAVPGITNRVTLTIDQEGTYSGQCAEFCGLLHGDMRFSIHAVPAGRFRRLDPRGVRRRPHHDHRRARAGAVVGAHTSRRSGIVDFATTTDHKKIGLLYIVTAFVFFLLGGLLSLRHARRAGAARAAVHRSDRPTTSCSRCTAR